MTVGKAPRLPTAAEVKKIEADCVRELQKLSLQDPSGNFSNRVCIFCDRLLEGKDDGASICNKQLKQICKTLKLDKTNFRGSYTNAVLSCYGLADDEDEPWKFDMVLSPRSKNPYESQSSRNLCCQECYHSVIKANPTMPPFAIAKGFIIGHAPKVLQDLSVTELAIVSRTRTVAHVFSFFGGQHKSIRGWHTFYEANLPHTMNVLEKLDDFGLPKKIFAVLTGPFTTPQKARVLKALAIDREKIKNAYNWLRENNVRYKGLPPIDLNNLPEMQIIDDNA